MSKTPRTDALIASGEPPSEFANLASKLELENSALLLAISAAIGGLNAGHVERATEILREAREQYAEGAEK